MEQAGDLQACENLATVKYIGISHPVEYREIRLTAVRPCMRSKGYTLAEQP